MIATAHSTPSPAAASAHAPASPSLELLEARQLRDSLRSLLRREQSAMAEFLVALADFDRRRGWERLGHASLFAFLNVELGLSKGAAFVRSSAARLLQAHPGALEPLRDGRLCLSSVAELGRVVTPANFAEVLPRFFGCSSREAREVAAAIVPREAPPVRDQVTRLAPVDQRRAGVVAPGLAIVSAAAVGGGSVRLPTPSPAGAAAALTLAAPVDCESVRAHELDLTQPARVHPRYDQVEPLTADLRRLHVTVSRRFLASLDAARDGLSNAIPGATTEQVLQAALDSLLEKQAKARGQVRRPRRNVAAAEVPPSTASPGMTVASTPGADSGAGAGAGAGVGADTGTGTDTDTEAGRDTEAGIDADAGTDAARSLARNSSGAPPEGLATGRGTRREGHREAIPAAVRRAVWERDGGRCAWPLDGGGRCGSTHRLQLDHIVPWARGGSSSADNLRVACGQHNGLAARRAFGERWMRRYAGTPA